MSHQSLKTFIDLITFDQEVIALRKNLEKSEKKIVEIEKNLKEEGQKLVLAESKKHDVVKMVHQQELVLKDIQDQEKSLLKKMEKISDSRAYDAGIKELDQIRNQQSADEQKYIQLTNKSENSQKDFISIASLVEENIKKHQDLIVQERQTIEEIKVKLADIEKLRAEKVVGISLEWLDLYEMMKDRVSDPVVAMSQESCSFCFYGLTPRDLQILKNNGLLQCKECFRLLYEQS